jgi:hypothetical protein
VAASARPATRSWIFPLVRRLERDDDRFAGGGGRQPGYFQRFYRDVRLDEGTTIR